MLTDIDDLTTMIEESLQYLSSTATAEPLRKVDISSLLRTITSQFCDLGHNVVYCGPERFGYLCQQKALIRAITNIAENAVRFGTKVAVELRIVRKVERSSLSAPTAPALREHADAETKQRFINIVRQFIQKVVIGKTPGHQPASLEVHGRIASILPRWKRRRSWRSSSMS